MTQSNINWRDVGVNFGDANSALNIAQGSMSNAGTIFGQLRRDLLEAEQKQVENTYRQRAFDENVRQFGEQHALNLDKFMFEKDDTEQKRLSEAFGRTKYTPESLFETGRYEKGNAPSLATSDQRMNQISGMIPNSGKIGSLTAKSESGSSGIKAFNPKDRDGASYGTYQIHSKNMSGFADYLDKIGNTEAAKALRDTGGDLTKTKQVWDDLVDKKLLNQDMEHGYMMESHFNPALDRIRNINAKETISSNPVLQEVLFSTATQHGMSGGPEIINKVYKEGMSPEELINAIYDERTLRSPDTKSRYDNERTEALSMLNSFGISAGSNDTTGNGQWITNPINNEKMLVPKGFVPSYELFKEHADNTERLAKIEGKDSTSGGKSSTPSKLTDIQEANIRNTNWERAITKHPNDIDSAEAMYNFDNLQFGIGIDPKKSHATPFREAEAKKQATIKTNRDLNKEEVNTIKGNIKGNAAQLTRLEQQMDKSATAPILRLSNPEQKAAAKDAIMAVLKKEGVLGTDIWGSEFKVANTLVPFTTTKVEDTIEDLLKLDYENINLGAETGKDSYGNPIRIEVDNNSVTPVQAKIIDALIRANALAPEVQDRILSNTKEVEHQYKIEEEEFKANKKFKDIRSHVMKKTGADVSDREVKKYFGTNTDNRIQMFNDIAKSLPIKSNRTYDYGVNIKENKNEILEIMGNLLKERRSNKFNH